MVEEKKYVFIAVDVLCNIFYIIVNFRLAQMLSKFRIPTSSVEFLEDLNKKPQSDT